MAGKTALFLDFDGTLAEIVDHPEEVSVHSDIISALERLCGTTGGAVAIVTGRAIQDIDHFLVPLKLPVAGVHGLERRAANGAITSATTNSEALLEVSRRLERLQSEIAGTQLERKPGSVAFHYRKRPELAEECIAAVHHAIEGMEGLQILHGKMVVEVKAGRATKADAIAEFMHEEPFEGRIPVFAGDDVTDEDAFGEIARRGGISIKIGGGDTTAGFRVAGTEDFRNWLLSLATSFEGQMQLDKEARS
ncbi:trehalose 6-phosphatase [Mesorhizobium sp. J18]|uniref:trehalose-phosphatase n=1 Tax=Mesorhizobium sp. J18 TaxID=935263 RepID=UPI00119C4812|nr:trehalose-phosphatase [Mesorhizobium sp. J18]TWH01122.1 trehalose 6-phosphatase [Mesorhizobium sp. J18]